MPRIELTQVIYDAKSRAFRAEAKLGTGNTARTLPATWMGPATASFARVSQGLAQSAAKNIT